MSKVKLQISKGTIQGIYSDDVMRAVKAIVPRETDISLTRASHIDPAADSGTAWKIIWLNHVADWGITLVDEDNQPFNSKHDAELFEVARLERDYFKRKYVGQKLTVAGLKACS